MNRPKNYPPENTPNNRPNFQNYRVKVFLAFVLIILISGVSFLITTPIANASSTQYAVSALAQQDKALSRNHKSVSNKIKSNKKAKEGHSPQEAKPLFFTNNFSEFLIALACLPQLTASSNQSRFESALSSQGLVESNNSSQTSKNALTNALQLPRNLVLITDLFFPGIIFPVHPAFSNENEESNGSNTEKTEKNRVQTKLNQAEPAERPQFRLASPTLTGHISSGFGMRHGHPHNGIDIAAPYKTRILSAESGKVTFSGWQAGYGRLVTVNHGNGFVSRYAHCAKILVKKGQTVSKGQTIATIGSSGHSTGPHLHFEIKHLGKFKDPARLIQFSSSLQVANVRRDNAS
ncbi:MAG: M23 family metallopeptidase [Cyanobacteria bacterium P01_H01_bin.74]